MMLIKLGGSVITDKSQYKTLNRDVVRRLCTEINDAKLEGGVVIVHGAGSYGHVLAKKYDLNGGFSDSSQIPAIARVQSDVRELNLEIIKELNECGIPAISIPPGSSFIMDGGTMSNPDIEVLNRALEHGLVPVLFGDVAFDRGKGFGIMSGDLLMKALCSLLGVTKAIFVSDVDGLCTSNPKMDPKARMIEHVSSDILDELSYESSNDDVTGGVLGKMRAMLDMSSLGMECILLNGLVPGRLKDALNGVEVVSTSSKPSTSSEALIERRKDDHIRISIGNNVSSDVVDGSYWGDVRLLHDALPETDMDEIDTTVTVFGRKLSFPLIVTAITGGFSGAERINANLAKACAEIGIGFGIGSERAGLMGVGRRSYSIIKDYDVPLVIGNVGAPQLIAQGGRPALSRDDIRDAFELIDADLMAVHLNFLQEVVQPEGDKNARGCLDAIRGLASDFPMIVKETGAGISKATVDRLKGIGIKGIDVAGTGGTSFPLIEMHRARTVGEDVNERLGDTFGGWGIPAPVSLHTAKGSIPIIASGGIARGTHIASSIAMGACCGGCAMEVLKAATISYECVLERLNVLKEEFKSAMFLTGSKNVEELSKADHIVLGRTREWMEELKWMQSNI